MSSGSEFRSSEQEVLRLLEECVELRHALKTMSAQIGRMENRVKRAFPVVAEKAREHSTLKRSKFETPSILPEQAWAEFDAIVKLAASGAADEAERTLRDKSAPDLLVIAKELGITFPKSKPSVNAMREAIFGKVRESILLARHNPRIP